MGPCLSGYIKEYIKIINCKQGGPDDSLLGVTLAVSEETMERRNIKAVNTNSKFQILMFEKKTPILKLAIFS